MELRLPLEMSPGREAACRAVFGTWGFFPNDARKNCPFAGVRRRRDVVLVEGHALDVQERRVMDGGSDHQAEAITEQHRPPKEGLAVVRVGPAPTPDLARIVGNGGIVKVDLVGDGALGDADPEKEHMPTDVPGAAEADDRRGHSPDAAPADDHLHASSSSGSMGRQRRVASVRPTITPTYNPARKGTG